MTPALLERYPDYPLAEVLTNEDLEVADTAVRALREKLKRKGTPKEYPIPSTAAQEAHKINEDFPDPNSLLAQTAIEIAIIELKREESQQHTVPTF